MGFQRFDDNQPHPAIPGSKAFFFHYFDCSTNNPDMQATIRTLFLIFCCFCFTHADAQIKPPGYEREIRESQNRPEASFMDRDSVTLTDTILVVDPETFEETILIKQRTYSLRGYCINELSVAKPDYLFDGKTHKITNPVTYEDLYIRWNQGAGKLDTVPQ